MSKNDEVKTYALYGGDIYIDFQEKPYHIYKLKGEKLISVTSITGQLDKSGPLKYWAVNLMRDFIINFVENNEDLNLEILKSVIEEGSKQHTLFLAHAQTIGDQVHDFAEAYAKWKLGSGERPSLEDLSKEAMHGVNGFLDWYNSKKIENAKVERVLYSKKYHFVGKTDKTATIDGKRSIIDYKTANGIYIDNLLQISLYWAAAEEEENQEYEQGIILRFNKETGEFHEHTVSRELYLVTKPIALSLLKVKEGLSNALIKEFLK